MTSFKRIFRENLEEYQAHVEDMLDIDLGRLSLHPMWQFPFREISLDYACRHSRDVHNSLAGQVRLLSAKLRLAWKFGRSDDTLGRAGANAIYYKDNEVTSRLPDEYARYALLHEIYHIAYARVAGREDTLGFVSEMQMDRRVPEWMLEGFPEYMADMSCNALGIDTSIRKRYSRYNSELQHITDALASQRIAEPKDVAYFAVHYRESPKLVFIF